MANTATMRLRSAAGDSLAFAARFGSGTTMVTDSGRDPEGPSPVELVLAGLGACGAMDVISILRKKRLAVTDYEVVVTGERAPEHPRRYTRIEVLHRVTGHDIPRAAVEEAVRLSDTKYCSVHATLEPAVELVSRIEIVPA